MLTPQNISSILKERAQKIIDTQRVYWILTAVLVMFTGFITAIANFEDNWPALLIGIVVGAIIFAISQRLDFPISALQLYAYGEMLDRMNTNKPSAAKVSAPVGPNTPKAPEPKPAPNTTVRPAAPIEQIPTWKRVQMEMEAKRKAEQEQQ